MDDFDKIFWGFIFSAIGIAFGWTLNQVGQWFRASQEDKKSLKVVLFHLLETYFIFTRSDFDKYFQKVTDKVYSKIPQEDQSEEIKVLMHAIYSGFLASYLKSELLEDLKITQKSYQDSIKILATIDPLTAYYLNGRTNIVERFDTIQSWLGNLKEQFPDEGSEIENGAKQALKIMKPDLVNDSFLDLEKDIRKISWKISPYVWYRSIQALKRLKSNANEKLEKEIDELLNKALPLFVRQ